MGQAPGVLKLSPSNPEAFLFHPQDPNALPKNGAAIPGVLALPNDPQKKQHGVLKEVNVPSQPGYIFTSDGIRKIKNYLFLIIHQHLACNVCMCRIILITCPTCVISYAQLNSNRLKEHLLLELCLTGHHENCYSRKIQTASLPQLNPFLEK